jgi:hypothetical protein
VARDFQQHHPIVLSTEEVKIAITKVSWLKATSTDQLPDTLLHHAVKNDEHLDKLTTKIQEFMNDPYWPSYLFRARLIPLSKNGSAYTGIDQVRTISVISPLAKLIERIILNRMLD